MLPFFFKKWEEAQNWVRMAALQAIQGYLLSNGPIDAKSKVLCVDDDRSFCHFMERLARSLGIRLDNACSIEEAKRIIEANPDYHAYIIDGHLPDGSGFELAAWIREKKGVTKPIGFISRIYHDARSFRLLKEKLNVDFVLDKPIRTAEAHQLLIQLCRLEKIPSISAAFSSELLNDLKSAYQKSISDKVERLEKLILAIEKNPSIINLHDLRNEVHKIGGSAGSYGYMAVSELCKDLELELISQIDQANQSQVNRQWIAELDDFFAQIKLHFQLEFPEEDQQRSGRILQLPFLYIVDEDPMLLKSIAHAAEDLRFEILTETRPDEAIQTLLRTDFYPQIFLLNYFYGSSDLTGQELLKAFYRRNDYLTTIIGFLTSRGAWSDLIEALQKGMTFVIEKPFNVPLIFHLLDQAPFRALPLPFKILVIDDDCDSCQYILQTLKYAGLEASAFGDFRSMDRQLKQIEPDVVLLDLNLADKSGISLLEKLKKLTSNKPSIVGMVTVTPQDSYSLQMCFDAGVDEIIFKPLDRGVLQRKIAALLKRKANLIMGLKSQESIPVFASREILDNYINELLRHPTPPLPKILVMFEVDEFDQLGEKKSQLVINGIAQSLEDLLGKYECAAYLERGKFALIFQGYDPHFVQLFMRTFFQSLSEELLKPKKKKELVINESLVVISSEKSAAEIIQKGERLLKIAKAVDNPVLRMIMEPAFIPLKEVVILHDKEKPLDPLKAMFKKNGFKVTLKDALDEEGILSVIPMPLLILTGSYGGLKCLPLLKRWSMQNQVQIPTFVLSHFPDENALLNLLNEVNYFDAPFSLVIIISENQISDQDASFLRNHPHS